MFSSYQNAADEEGPPSNNRQTRYVNNSSYASELFHNRRNDEFQYSGISSSAPSLLFNRNDYQSQFLLSATPPPPPPILVNCGEITEQHDGRLIEIVGKVTRSRLGRFIEIKDKFGIIQLVAPNVSITKRFINIPLESLITVIGYVRKRPDTLQNLSHTNGKVEIHVEDITKVQKSFSSYYTNTDYYSNNGNKRNYSTMVHDQRSNRNSKAITSNEYRKTSTSENVLKHFINREYTCGCLRLDDVNKLVTLVGWIRDDGNNKTDKFIQLHDGYGQTQIVIDKNEFKKKILNITENDIICVKGRVVARPNTYKTLSNQTGDIEVYCNSLHIVNPNDKYDGQIINELNPEKFSMTKSTVGGSSFDVDDSINNPTNMNKQKLPAIPNINLYTYRTHNCGELNESHIGNKVILCGWLGYSRLKKFFTLRDGYGHTQIIIPDELIESTTIENIAFETILIVKGCVTARPPGMRNVEMETGAIEIVLQSLEILNEAKTNLPIEVRNFNRSREVLRMQYRYIDLRFKDMQNNLRTRSKILMKIREHLIHHSGFIEVETPTLFRRTPGGAQEFIVPTRKPGQFYSLVQSPQQFKQMLMVGAIDRYFQIARCYRDETTRPDRQPEFTQLDIELSFTDRDSILQLIEDLLMYCWPTEINVPFKRLTYDQAMDNYGIDKPDIRFPLELKNITTFLQSNDEEFMMKQYNEWSAYAIPLKAVDYSNLNLNAIKRIVNKEIVNNVKLIVTRIDKDLSKWMKACDLSIFNGDENIMEMVKLLNLTKCDTIIMGYGPKRSVQTIMGRIRLQLWSHFEENKCVPKRSNKEYQFLWIVDFPMFSKTEEDNTHLLESTHHPFTAPHPDDEHLLWQSNHCESINNENAETSIEQTTNDLNQLLKIRSQAYDLVLNGQEIGGGSIRIHNSNLQRDILSNILKIDFKHLQHLLDALESGCPPHGGIALGLDRILSIICDANSIRDVIAFPKSIDGKDLLSKAPCSISDDEMKLYNLSIIKNGNNGNIDEKLLDDGQNEKTSTSKR